MVCSNLAPRIVGYQLYHTVLYGTVAGRGGYNGVLDGELTGFVGVAQMVGILPRNDGAEHFAITLAILAGPQHLAQIQVLCFSLRVPLPLNVGAVNLYKVLPVNALNKAVLVNGVDGELDGMVSGRINVHNNSSKL